MIYVGAFHLDYCDAFYGGAALAIDPEASAGPESGSEVVEWGILLYTMS